MLMSFLTLSGHETDRSEEQLLDPGAVLTREVDQACAETASLTLTGRSVRPQFSLQNVSPQLPSRHARIEPHARAMDVRNAYLLRRRADDVDRRSCLTETSRAGSSRDGVPAEAPVGGNRSVGRRRKSRSAAGQFHESAGTSRLRSRRSSGCHIADRSAAAAGCASSEALPP